MNILSKFRKEAENNFSNYNGNGGYIGGENYVGNDNYQADGVALSDIDSQDRTLTFGIINTDTANKLTAILFGAYSNVGTGNTFQPTGIEVTVGESSHDQVRSESTANPLLIRGMKYFVTNALQLSNTWQKRISSSAGGDNFLPIQPNTYRNAQNNILTQIDAPEFQLAVSGKTSLLVPTNASEDMTIIFFIKTRGNIEQILKGDAVLTVAPNSAPVGLPQIDLATGRRL